MFKKKDGKLFDIHGKPIITRRDFLSSGALSFSASFMLPSLGVMLAKSGVAQAQEIVCSSGGGEWVPLITLNLAGGSGLSAHWLPLDKGGQLLSSYSKMGWGLPTNFSVDKEFANKAPFFQGSTFLAGVRSMAQPTALAATNFVGLAVRSNDDSGANAFDITGMARKMGLNGAILGNLGTRATMTGNNTQPAFVAPPAALPVGSYNDLVAALGVSDSLKGLVDAGLGGKLFETIEKLSEHQVRRLAALNGGSQLEDIIVCRARDNTKLTSNANGANTDPLANTAYSAIWGLTANTARNSQSFVFGSLVFNALNGNSGSVNLTIGGYDYHNGTRTRGDLADADAGVVVGRILQSCMVMNKPAMILVVSDGSVQSPESDSPMSPWTSDSGNKGAAYMLHIDPSGIITNKGYQLGSFTNGQAVDETSIVGASPQRAAAAMFVNYLNVNKKLGDIDKVLPRVLSAAEIEKMTILGVG